MGVGLGVAVGLGVGVGVGVGVGCGVGGTHSGHGNVHRHPGEDDVVVLGLIVVSGPDQGGFAASSRARGILKWAAIVVRVVSHLFLPTV